MRFICLRYLILAMAAAAAILPGVRAAHADSAQAIYHASISFNCDNPSYCVDQNGNPQLGGVWGSATVNSDGTGTGEFTGCSHTQGGGSAGAQHYSSTFTWTTGPGSAGPNTVFITSEVDTFTGRTGGPPVPIVNANPPYPSDTGVPLVPGHYSLHPAPGVSGEITVIQVPTS
jgi:hypothetical protein